MTFILKYKIYPCLFLFVLLSCSTDKTEKMLAYEGISFNYPRSWHIETEELSEESFFIKAKNRDDVMFITFTDNKTDLKEYIKTYYRKIDNTKVQLSTEPITDSKFGKYDALSSKFLITYLTARIYGSVQTFEAGGKYILIVKQSDTEGRVQRNFKVIEESFSVETNKDSIN